VVIEDGLLTRREVAQALHITEYLVGQMVKRNTLPTIAVGARYRIPSRAVRRLIEAEGVNQAGGDALSGASR
jgi:excisionase family DNA binding protein